MTTDSKYRDNEKLVRLGGFPVGSIPPALSFQYLDGDGNPSDMSQGTWSAEATASMLYSDSPPTDLGAGAASVVTGTSTASYAWHTDDFSKAGVFQLTLWSGNGTNRYGSSTFQWEVYDGPGGSPTV